MYINHTPINFLHGKFNCKYLMNPWQYEHGVCNNDDNDLSNSVNENNLLSWQLINSSRACVNKPFVAINTAKYELKT